MSESVNKRLDELEAIFVENGIPANCPLKHKFVGGMYVRTIFMPKGTVIVSLTHNQDHPFFVLKGKAIVYDEYNGNEIIEAPHDGITLKGTRRVLEILEDCIWCTTHITNILPTDHSDEAIEIAAAKVVVEVTEDRVNSLLEGKLINNIFIPTADLIKE